MNNKLTNLLLAIIAACLLVQTGLALNRIHTPAPVEITNDSIPVDLDSATIQLFGSPKDAIPVTIEGFNGKPFNDMLIGDGIPVEIVK